MNKSKEIESEEDLVLPGDKIAVIEEFVPDDTCYEDEGVIYSTFLGKVNPDSKKHKISVQPLKKYQEVKVGDMGIGLVQFIKKQIASIDVFYINNEYLPVPFSSILHVSEASRRFVRSMFEVTRPGDWIKVRIIRTMKPVYVSLVGHDLGVIIAYCVQCGYELEFKRRNTLLCPNCDTLQPRITSRNFGKPLKLSLGSSLNETR
ncbi:MAG: hypothetical protein EAX86_09050 [Candidatus Heimdallarchaeota archaeon]|nr:hypothetical protein [Candidatus Heimdallarchaeota archaeon]